MSSCCHKHYSQEPYNALDERIIPTFFCAIGSDLHPNADLYIPPRQSLLLVRASMNKANPCLASAAEQTLLQKVYFFQPILSYLIPPTNLIIFNKPATSSFLIIYIRNQLDTIHWSSQSQEQRTVTDGLNAVMDTPAESPSVHSINLIFMKISKKRPNSLANYIYFCNFAR